MENLRNKIREFRIEIDEAKKSGFPKIAKLYTEELKTLLANNGMPATAELIPVEVDELAEDEEAEGE